MIESRLSDILDGVSVIVVLLLILIGLIVFYGQRISRSLDRRADPRDE